MDRRTLARRQFTLGLALCASLLAKAGAGAPPQHSDAAEALPIKTLLEMPSIAPAARPTLAPDGTLMTYAVVDPRRVPLHVDTKRTFRTGVPSQALGADIWVSDLTSGNSRNITAGIGNNWAPTWSPNGKYIAFFSDRQDTAQRGKRSDSADSSPKAQLWLWDRASGKLRQIDDLPLVYYTELEWSADSRSITVRLQPENISREQYLRSLGAEVEQTAVPDPNAVTVRVFSFDPAMKGTKLQADAFNLDIYLGDLALVDVVTGEVRRVVHGQHIQHFAISPDRNLLAYTTLDGFDHPGSQLMVGGISLYDLQSGTSRVLANRIPRNLLHFFVSWSPHSDAIAYQGGAPGQIKDDVYVVSVRGGTPRRIAEGILKDPDKSWRDAGALWAGDQVIFGRERALWRVPADGSSVARRFAELPGSQVMPIDMGSGQMWSPDNACSAILFTFNLASKHAGLARLDLESGAITSFYEEEKNVFGGLSTHAVVTPDRQSVIYAAEDASHPADFWRAPASGQPPRQVTHIASELTRFNFGHADLIEWRDLDGNVLRGALLYPVGYEPGKRYPMIVDLYGGAEVSSEVYRFGFSYAPVDNLQVFATRDYAVLFADSRQKVGTPMSDLLKTVMPGVDRAVEIGLADPDRIGIIGHSYGGYSVLSVIVQTHRFKAAVASASIGDLISAYGSMLPDGTNFFMGWAETGQGLMGGNLWEYRNRYIENSPIFYLDRVTTPLLLINGSQDLAPGLADETFSDLRRLGKPVEYARYQGEEHWPGSWSMANQEDYLNRVIAWFDRYLQKSSRTP